MGIVAQASWSKYDYLLAADTDGVPANFFSFSQTEHQDQKTFEVRLNSPADSKLEYTLGAYYLESKLSVDTTLNFPFATVLLAGPLAALAPYAPLSGAIALGQEEKGISVFGSATYPITEQLSVTAGVRYTYSRKKGLQSATNATGNDLYGLSVTPLPSALQPVAAFLTGFNDHTTGAVVSDEDFLPSVSLQYKATPDISLYAKYSKGFKAGGFDAVELTGIASNLTFKPETVDSYEAGMKSFLLDHTLSLDVALFHNDYKNLQQSVPQYTATAAFIRVTNVGGLQTQGIEAGLLWSPIDRLQIRQRHRVPGCQLSELHERRLHRAAILSGAAGWQDCLHTEPVGQGAAIRSNLFRKRAGVLQHAHRRIAQAERRRHGQLFRILLRGRGPRSQRRTACLAEARRSSCNR